MISTSTELLRDALSRARLIASTRTAVMPIYANVMLKARPENAWLTITASSPEAQIALDVDSEIDGVLELCVDAERLALALNVPGEKTKLSLDGERLKIATGKSVFRLPHIQAENFPILLSQGENIASFGCEWLAAALRRVLPFTGSSDHARLDSRGVSLKGRDGKVKIEGTTHATCAQLVHDVKDAGEFTVMLPTRVCEVLCEVEPTRAIFKQGTAVFLGENMQLVTVYLQAQLADTDRVFPAEGCDKITVARKELVDAVKSVSAISDVMMKRVRPVKLAMADDALVIEALGISAEGRAEVAASGKKWECAYDAAFVLALAHTSEDEKIELLQAAAPDRLAIADGNFRAVVVGSRA